MLKCTYIDTCLPSALEDLHSRDNEYLLCTDATQPSIDWVIQELFNHAMHCEDVPLHITNRMLMKALTEEFDKYFLWQICIDDNMSDNMFIYAYLSW